jgi:hypothetical protein
MIISADRLRDIAAQTLARIDAPPGCAMVLEGSIAEGFGNPSSDIDFLLVTDDDVDRPTMPTVLFMDGRRVEVRTRSAAQLADQFAQVRGSGPLQEDLLNRCQRVLGSYVLHGDALMARVKALLPKADFADTMARWWAHHARHSLLQALALDTLGEEAEAASWSRSALVQAAKSWLVTRGETYLEPKWLSMQLDRAGDPVVAVRYWELDESGGLASRVTFAAELGVEVGDGEITVENAPGVTTWPVGERVHVVRDRRDVFALGAEAAQVWRTVVFGRSVAQTVAGAEATGVSRPGELLADFLRLGLFRLERHGETVTPRLPLGAPAGPISPPPSDVRPPVRLAGAAADGDRSVALLPLPAVRFSATAMTLVWSNVLIENAREDLRGAVERGQWRVCELSARRVVLASARSLLSAYGVNPLPPDSDVVRRLCLLPAALRPIRERALRIEALRVDSAETAAAVLAELAEFVAVVRTAAGAPEFPASFDTALAWDDTLAIGYDWLRLGAYLDADLPIDEARDLLASGGAQPHERRDQ